MYEVSTLLHTFKISIALGFLSREDLYRLGISMGALSRSLITHLITHYPFA